METMPKMLKIVKDNLKLEEFCAKSIGVPFKPHGRDGQGWDCWGLICCAYKEVYGINLEDHHEKYDSLKEYDVIKEAFATVIHESLLKGWDQVTEQEPGDVIVFYMRGEPIHVGLAFDKYRMMHVEHGIETCLQNTREYRIEGIYRYVG